MQIATMLADAVESEDAEECGPGHIGQLVKTRHRQRCRRVADRTHPRFGIFEMRGKRYAAMTATSSNTTVIAVTDTVACHPRKVPTRTMLDVSAVGIPAGRSVDGDRTLSMVPTNAPATTPTTVESMLSSQDHMETQI